MRRRPSTARARRQGLEAWLSAHGSQIEVLGTAPTVAALRTSPAWGAEVVLLDLNLQDGSSVTDNVAELVDAGSQVVVVSENETPGAVRGAVRAGAGVTCRSRRWRRRCSRPSSRSTKTGRT